MVEATFHTDYIEQEVAEEGRRKLVDMMAVIDIGTEAAKVVAAGTIVVVEADVPHTSIAAAVGVVEG